MSAPSALPALSELRVCTWLWMSSRALHTWACRAVLR